jgi:hypothetical protein
LVAELVA